MRILQLSKHYPPYFGGIESVTYDLTKGLNELGYPCDVLCANDKWKTVVNEIDGYKIWRMFSFGKLFSTSISPQIIIKLKRIYQEYDIIHVHFPDPMNALALYLTRPKAKIVVHWHSDIIKQSKALLFYKPLQDWILRRSDVIVGTSPIYVKGASALYPFLNKTVVIPIGIEDRKLFFSLGKVNEIRHKFGDKKIIFSLGRLIYYKGFEYLIEASQNIDEDCVILIGGEGKLMDQLKIQIYNSRLQDKVYLLGKIPQNELGSYFRACDVFCLPSVERAEAFGVVLLEAMSFGKPIVATKIPESGVSWVNEHGITGFNVPVRSSVQLAEKINLLLKDKGLYDTISVNSRKRFQEEFTACVMVKKFIELYEEVD